VSRPAETYISIGGRDVGRGCVEPPYRSVADNEARELVGNEVLKRAVGEPIRVTMRKDGKVAGLRWWMPGLVRALAVGMLTMDEPDHTRLRSIVDEPFRRRAVFDAEPRSLVVLAVSRSSMVRPRPAARVRVQTVGFGSKLSWG
jgi:hypothetical protein